MQNKSLNTEILREKLKSIFNLDFEIIKKNKETILWPLSNMYKDYGFDISIMTLLIENNAIEILNEICNELQENGDTENYDVLRKCIGDLWFLQNISFKTIKIPTKINFAEVFVKNNNGIPLKQIAEEMNISYKVLRKYYNVFKAQFVSYVENYNKEFLIEENLEVEENE